MKHTEWIVEECWSQTEGDSFSVETSDGVGAEKEFIVKACNNHYQLLEVLEVILHKTSEYQRINTLGNNCKKGRTIQNIGDIAQKVINEALS